MRILICKFGGLRSALAVSASLRAIKEVHPGANVTYITSPGAEMATQGCPVITETVTYHLNSTVSQFAALISHLRRQDFDYAIALSSHPMARALVACCGATRKISAGKVPFYLAPLFHQQVRGLLVDPHEAARDHAVFSEIFNISSEVPPMWYASSRMEAHGLLVEPQKYIVIHPGASHPSQILEIDKWAQVSRELLSAGLIERVIVSAGPSSEERIMADALCGLIGPAAFSTRGQLTLAQFAKLLQEARLFMGADSAILQLASAVKVPVLGVYGPSDYNRSRPWGTLSRSVRIDTTMFEGEDLNDYNERMNRAMGRITAQQIFRAADDLLRISKV